MPDITMCSNDTCELGSTCYRRTATPDPVKQSWAWFEPMRPTRVQIERGESEVTCRFYLETEARRDEGGERG